MQGTFLRMARGALLALVALGIWSGEATAAPKYARTTGNWGTNGNWSSVSCAAAGATTFPTAADDVTICNGVTITVDAAGRAANSVTIETGATATGLTFAAGSSLNVTNNLVIDTPTGAVIKQVDVATGTLTVGGNVTLNGGTVANRDALLTVSSGLVTINGGVTINATVATSSTVSITAAGGGITVNGAAGVTNRDVLSVGPGIFSVTNAAATLTTSDAAIASTTSVTTGTLTIAGNAVVDSGAVGASSMTVTTGVISIGGGLNVTTASATNNNGDATVSVTTGRIDVTGNVTVTGGTNNQRDALLTVTGAGAAGQGVNIGGTLNIVSAVAGSATVSTTNATSRITVNGAGGVNNEDTLSVGPGIVSLTNAAATLTNSDPAIAATITISTGTLSVAGSLNNASGETLACSSTCNIAVGGTFNSSGTFTPSTGIVTLNGSTAQTISGTSPVAFGNLTVTNTANPNITLTTNVTVSGTLTGTVTLTNTCPTDYTLTSVTPAQVLHSCPAVPASFNAFEPPTAPTTCATLPVATNSGPIKTKISGTTYPLCVVALDSSATPQILTTFNGDVKVEIVPTTNCLTTGTVHATMSPVTLTNGRASVSFSAVANAWPDVSVRISYPTTSPTVTKCSTNNYAIRPNSLSVTVTDGDWETAGTSRALDNAAAPGGRVHKAGRPFTITATAYNGAGTPAITTSYAGTPSVSIDLHIIPTSCLNGTACTLDGGTFSDGTANDGIVSSSTASYAEVGAFNMRLTDTTFAAVDAGDSTTTERYITSGSVAVGRFVPDHYLLLSGSRTPACTTGGAVLSYMDQPFTLATTLVAQNYAGGTAENYHPSSGGYAPAAVVWQAENADSGTNLGLRLANITSAWSNGSYAVNSTAAIFNRAAAPDGPYDTLQLGVQLTDPDGPVLGGLDMNAATSGACAPCTGKVVGAPISVRFGRLRLQNALGPELRPLPVPVWAEYWNGTAFARNTQDSCTTIGAVTPGGVAPCTLTPVVSGVGTALSSGAGTLSLAAPGVRGCADLTMTAPSWLKGRWSGATYTQDPTARATFGVFRDRVLYRRENY